MRELSFVCEIDDCFMPATVFVQGRLLCTQHAMPVLLKAGGRKVERGEAEWLQPKDVHVRHGIRHRRG